MRVLHLVTAATTWERLSTLIETAATAQGWVYSSTTGVGYAWKYLRIKNNHATATAVFVTMPPGDTNGPDDNLGWDLKVDAEVPIELPEQGLIPGDQIWVRTSAIGSLCVIFA